MSLAFGKVSKVFLGGGLSAHLGNQSRNAVRSYVAKSYLETYKSCDHMQKIRPISQDFNEILTFENVEKMRFCHTLTYENRHNALNFLDRGLEYCI